MLELVETKSEKIAVQRRFAKAMESAWNRAERRTVVWRPSSKVLPIAHNGLLWFAQIRPHDDQHTLRYWNSFGVYDDSGNLQIAVEINIPVESNTNRVSGFFAKDQATGCNYLMHDGGVGGGRPGIGQEKFLRWSSKRPVPVMTSDGSYRFGIIVSEIDSASLSANVSSFVQSVIDFKAAATAAEPAVIAEAVEGFSYKDYFKEFSGRKKGIRRKEFEYITRHGDIVHALSSWVLKSRENSGLKVIKNAYIDLGVLDDKGRLIELYEVKTNASRQTLYTAIGQLLVHETQAGIGVEKVMVLPKSEAISGDVQGALKALGIDIIFFELRGQAVYISD